MIYLYEVDERLKNAFDEETGELLISEEELDAIFKAEKDGLNYFMAQYKNALATAEALSNEAKKLKKRADAYTKIAEKAFSKIEKHLEGNPYESEYGKVSYRKSSKCEQMDEMAFLTWDERFSYGKSEFKPSVADIKSAIKAGKKIPGWQINEYNNMSIN